MRALLILILTTLFVGTAPLCAASEITPEDLLMTTLTQPDVMQCRLAGEVWWPELPEFVVGMDDMAIKEQFYVTQNYCQVDTPGAHRILTAVTLYNTDAEAKGAFAAMLEASDKDAKLVSGPAVGDETRCFMRASRC